MKHTYITVEGAAQASHTEKRSEFIGYIAHAARESDALSVVASVRAKHRDARHNVYAYITDGGSVTRFSDDGEPSGTGGIPCLEVLRSNGLCDTVVVVTRYFGGVLLGAPGLVRAYTKAAAMAAAEARRAEVFPCRRVSAEYDYRFHGKISAYAADRSETDESVFGDTVRQSFFVQDDSVDGFVDAIAELTGGTALVTVGDEVMRSRSC